MKSIVLLIASIVVVPALVEAQSNAMDTTEALASSCRLYVQLTTSQAVPAMSSDKYIQTGFCIGYVAGFAHALSLAGISAFCLPDGINLSDAVKSFLKYVDEHPQELHQSAKVTVSHALQNAYPCKPKV